MHWPKINRNVLKVDSEAGRPVDESINNDIIASIQSVSQLVSQSVSQPVS